MSYRKSNQSEMYSIVERYLSRNNNQAEFCQENNISKSTIGYWICKYNRENRKDKSSSDDFIKLSPVKSSQSQLTATLPNGISIYGSGSNFNISVSEIYRQTQ